MKKLSFVLVIAVVLAGCGETSEPVQSVDWYKAHEAERTDMIAKCKANPGELVAAPNCINATQAANELTLDKRGYTKRAPINVSEGGK